MPACVNYTAAAARVVHDPRTRTLPSLCGMNNQPTLLLQLPAPVVSFATIKLPVTAPATIDAFPSRTGLPLADKHTIRMHKLWHAINMQQPGGPLVAFPCSATQCQVICHKQATVAAVFKALKAQQNQLGIRMPDVKSCVSLTPLSKPELSTAYGLALQAGLSAWGWFTLGQQNMLDKSLWELDVGLQQSVQSVRFHASALAPDQVALRMETGTTMVRFFDLQRCLPASHQEMLGKSNISYFLRMDNNMQAANQAVEGLPCSVLPEGRPAIISHLSNTIPEEADLRNWWLVSMGLKLPADIAYFVHVRFEDDYDAPTLPYPSCCVLTPWGMAYSAHKPGSSSQVQAMKTVAGLLSEPLPFWKGKATILMNRHGLSATPCSTQEHSPASQKHTGWATATERQHQEHSLPELTCRISSTADPAAVPWSDFLPVDDILAAVPVRCDAAFPAFQRPRRPKVQVSDSLKSLLDSTAQRGDSARMPNQAAWQPASKAQSSAAKAAVPDATPVRKIMFSKRVLPTIAKPNNPDQLQTNVQQQFNDTLPMAAPAADAAKRPATMPAAVILPSFTKRPKLAGSRAGAVKSSSKAAAGGNKEATGTKKKAAAKKPAASKLVPTATGHVAASAALLPVSVAADRIQSSSITSVAAIVSAVNPPFTAGNTIDAAAPANTPEQHPMIQGQSATVATERPAAATVAPVKAPRQRKKAEDIDLAVVEKKIREKHASGSLNDLSIPEMKCFLKAHKVPVGGKKAELIARLEPLLGKA